MTQFYKSLNIIDILKVLIRILPENIERLLVIYIAKIKPFLEFLENRFNLKIKSDKSILQILNS